MKSAVQYSAILDGNTCVNCSASDGETGKTQDDVVWCRIPIAKAGISAVVCMCLCLRMR